MKGFYLLSILILATPKTTLAMGKHNADLPRFYEVSPGKVYRGGQPSDFGLQLLSKMKIRTVLNVRRSSATQIQNEENLTHSLGMKYISVPLSGILSPKAHDMNYIESILESPSYQPVFIHCLHGQDRTGLAIGLYRVFYQSVSPIDAYHEMLDFGFHRVLFGLNHYFEERTGLEE
jgi:protein tyrosine/serine phosphatase